MALPTLVKTYQFNVNQTITATGTALNTNRALLRAIKDTLKAYATAPWTVRYSCDSSVAGTAGDGVDRWSTNANLVFASGAHSWFVLRNSNGWEICIDLNNASANGTSISFILSLAANFTGGTTSARPTATDEVVVGSNVSFGGSNSDVNHRLHVWHSSDAQVTRIAIAQGGFCTGFWMIDRAANPVSGWTTPVYAFLVGGQTAANILSLGNVSSAANVKARVTATMDIYLTSEARTTNQLKDVFTAANDLTSEYPFYPIGLASETASHRGRHGTVVDMWFGLASIPTADTYPADASRQFIQIGGPVILPWDGTVPQMV